MEEHLIRMQEILKSNKGFKNPKKWIDYALRHGFRKVEAKKLQGCPDCGERKNGFLGQYVYYSTLVQLRSCANCGLLFSDTRFDLNIVHGHFEQAYKDEEYFNKRRRGIFEQLTELIDVAAPLGANVLDIGGAKGHLLSILKERRPDLKLVLNDLSKTACEYAENHYGLESMCGAVNALERLPPRRFEVVVLSDVMYYEPELNRLWALLSRLVADSGTIIIRAPNLVSLIKMGGMARKLFSQNLDMQDRVWFLNPEHLYVLSRRYLSRRLQQVGFPTVEAVPSALLEEENVSRYRLYHYLARIAHFCTFGRTILTPSMIIIGRRRA